MQASQARAEFVRRWISCSRYRRLSNLKLSRRRRVVVDSRDSEPAIFTKTSMVRSLLPREAWPRRSAGQLACWLRTTQTAVDLLRQIGRLARSARTMHASSAIRSADPQTCCPFREPRLHLLGSSRNSFHLAGRTACLARGSDGAQAICASRKLRALSLGAPRRPSACTP